jgi:hypothetical protein
MVTRGQGAGRQGLRGKVEGGLEGPMKIIPASTGVPALATNKVAGVPPVHGVPAALKVGVGSLAAAVGPPGVEVAIMVALGVARRLTSLQRSRVAIVPLEEVKRSAESGSGRRRGKEERLERDHGCKWRGAAGEQVWISIWDEKPDGLGRRSTLGWWLYVFCPCCYLNTSFDISPPGERSPGSCRVSF